MLILSRSDPSHGAEEMKITIVIVFLLLTGILSFLYVVANNAKIEENNVQLQENNRILRDIRDMVELRKEKP